MPEIIAKYYQFLARNRQTNWWMDKVFVKLMKRYRNLFDKFCSFENLYLASQKAQKGKRYKYSTAIFNFNLSLKKS